MTEASAWSTIKTNFKKLAMPLDIQRIEDKLTNGVPDANVCLNGHEFWLEGKFVKDLPKRESTPVRVGLRPDQALWLENRELAGGTVFVWVRVRDYGWLLFRSGWRALQDGIPLSEFIKHPVHSTGKELVEEIAAEVMS